MFKQLGLYLSVVAVVGASACAKSPVEPAGPVSVTVAALTSPANGASFKNIEQPVTLTITNAQVSSSDAVTYTFEVATDVAFNNKVVSQDVAQGSGSTTSLKLGTLPAGADYYWRTRTSAGGTVGVAATPLKFTIGPAVTIQAPVPVSPVGTTGLSQRPTFTVTNAVRTGPVTSVSYRFEVSKVSTFATIAASATVAEQTTRTAWTPTSDLEGGTTYYWRAQAVDAGSGVVSAYSTTATGATQVVIDLTKVNYQRFTNISAWPITARIRAVEQDGAPPGPMCIDYDRRGDWPTSDFFGDPLVQVQANQWYFANIGGTWYGGSGENMRPNQICKQGQMSEAIGPDGTWGGPMDSWAPRAGELVGYMMTTPARFWPSMKTVDERSNMVVQGWIDTRVSSTASVKK